MCLAVPMELKVVRDDGTGVAELDGARYDVNLSLLTDATEGDHVIIHAGYAIEKLDREEADERLALFEALAELQVGAADDDAAKDTGVS